MGANLFARGAERMEQEALTRKDLEPHHGTRARVSEVLNKKRNLTLPLIKRLHEGVNVSYECLIVKWAKGKT